MSKYLIKTTEQYRCDTEGEAKQLIQDAKQSGEYSLIKSTDEIKNTKQKGEIVDEWHRVTLTKIFTEEKEPSVQMNVHYGNTEENFE